MSDPHNRLCLWHFLKKPPEERFVRDKKYHNFIYTRLNTWRMETSRKINSGEIHICQCTTLRPLARHSAALLAPHRSPHRADWRVTLLLVTTQESAAITSTRPCQCAVNETGMRRYHTVEDELPCSVQCQWWRRWPKASQQAQHLAYWPVGEHHALWRRPWGRTCP
jgi:hypothetical protein